MNKTISAKKKWAKTVLQNLRKLYPDAECSLAFQTPLELLIATILSAQCTDIQVNKVTAELFKQFRSAEDYADAPLEQLENAVRTTGFFRNKAKNIQNSCRIIIKEFGGNVPDTMESLTTLPGVGRKTANVVLSTAFGRNEGFVVDTHVFRLSHRLGIADGNTPEHVEQELMHIFPQSVWAFLSHALILHGRRLCKARLPLCTECPFKKRCSFCQS